MARHDKGSFLSIFVSFVHSNVILLVFQIFVLFSSHKNVYKTWISYAVAASSYTLLLLSRYFLMYILPSLTLMYMEFELIHITSAKKNNLEDVFSSSIFSLRSTVLCFTRVSRYNIRIECAKGILLQLKLPWINQKDA